MHVGKKVSKIADLKKISSRELFSYDRNIRSKSTKFLLNRAKRLVDTLTKLQVSMCKGYFSENHFVKKVEAELFLTLF